MKKFLFIISIIFEIMPVFAGVKFNNINEIYKISMRETSTVLKDENGFVWTASKTGVLRIADDDYRIYRLNYQNTDVLNIRLVYRKGVFIAYTNNGQVFGYDRIYDRFELLFNLKTNSETTNLSIYAANIDSNGDCWVVSNYGFFLYKNNQLTNIDLQLPEVTRIIEYENDNMLFVCGDSICTINVNSLQIKTLYRHKTSFTFRVYSLFYDSAKQKLWIGTRSDGIFQYSFANNTFAKIGLRSFPNLPVYIITPVTDSTVMAGIDGQGVWELSDDGNKMLNIYRHNIDDNYSLRGNGVLDVFYDSDDKRLWVCTYSGGLSYCNYVSSPVNQLVHETNNSNSLANNDVTQIIEDSAGNLWFATSNGISRLTTLTGRWDTFLQNSQTDARAFLALCEDEQKRIWAGTYSSGIYVLDEVSGQVLKHYSKGSRDNTGFDCQYVFDIIKDSNGDIWFGGVMDGLFCYKTKENRFERYSRIPLYSLEEMQDNRILAACSYGIGAENKQTKEYQRFIDGYLVNDILLADSIIWVCTSGSGLLKYNILTNTVKTFNTENGLPSDYINSVMMVDSVLWLGMETGLCLFNTLDCSVVNQSTDVFNVTFNRNACCLLRNGQIAFGTSGGAFIFSPAAIQKNAVPRGKIFIQDISVSGRSLRETENFNLTKNLDSLQNITLKYNQNNLTVEILPVGTNQSDTKFIWQLEGLDGERSHPSNFRKITYTNIPSGNYVLRIEMYDNSQQQCISTRTINIRVTPPFWAAWWFRLLLAVFLITIFYFLIRYYINKLKQRHTEDKVRFFANMAHEIRTVLTLIKAPIDELSRKEFPAQDKYFLNLVSEQAKRLSTTVTNLLDFQKADIGRVQLKLMAVNIPDMLKQRIMMFESLAKSKNIIFNIDTKPSEYESAIDKSKFETVIDNLITNAIKYSHPDSNVDILFKENGKAGWTLEVRDYGIGISRKSQKKLFREFYRSENAVNSNIPGSGIGLLLVKNYVSAHGGTIRCTSKSGEGSSFVVSMPHLVSSTAAGADLQSVPEIHRRELQTCTGSESQSGIKKPHLLVAEDNPDLLQFMQMALATEFEVIATTDGADAWEKICKQSPDIVVSDVLMPNISGFELCRLVKITFETSHIPVVLLTSLTDKENQLHGLDLRADDYLAKPFDIELVRQRIRSIIHNRQTVRDKALKMIDNNDNATLFANELDDNFIKKAVETVYANIANTEFRKEEFASSLNMSSSLLYKKLKALTDSSPVEFIRSIRMKKSLELLQSGKHTVTEVADLCGFSDLAYFGKAFKNHFGRNPSDV